MSQVMITFIYIVVFLYGITIGSFLNVCIIRYMKKEEIVKTRSHCMSCGYVLKWYDLIPVFSYLFLRGRCRKCKEKISIQYPLVEALNGILYIIIFLANGITVGSILYCLLTSVLIVISLIDFQTMEIPFSANVCIFVLGVVNLCMDYTNWKLYVIGFFAVSVFLYILWLVSGGRAIGGGDVKLMAAAGFLLGWKRIVFALIAGCILGSVIHIIRMKVAKADRTLAMGPYLSMGIYLSILFADIFWAWYAGGIIDKL